MSRNKLGDTHPRIGGERCQNLRLLLTWKMERMSPEILKKLQILNVQRMIRRRYAHGRKGQEIAPLSLLEDTAIPLLLAVDTAQAW